MELNKDIIIMSKFVNEQQVFSERWNMEDITEIKRPRGGCREECLTNMRYTHT
jgi:hypothetical protein